MSVSIIIPTLNEETYLGETLTTLQTHQPHEIIIVDGGSRDATCAIARAFIESRRELSTESTPDLSVCVRGTEAISDIEAIGIGIKSTDFQILHSPPGRARQMNLGAAHATGDILLFLHADCQLECGALEAAEHCLRAEEVVAGCFMMQVRNSRWIYGLIDACATARVRITGLIYGDQGLFLRRDLFQSLGGFPNLRFMEDVFFSRILHRRGRMVVSAKRIYISARRWQKNGVIHQTLRNWLLTALASAGVNPDQLVRFYPEAR
jgi:rSAM/selenodomain-associated transferase 2